jgi:hypothetical protein
MSGRAGPVMGPRLRKAGLVAHVVTSVGWLGAVACTLALSTAGMMSEDPLVVRSVYITLEVTGWWVLVPLSFLSLGTGVVQGLSTRWGVLSHYWVVIKLIINVVANVVLLLYMQTIEHLAGLARASAGTGAGLEELQDPSPLLHAAAALVLLVVATILSVYKPKGVTRYGQRRRQARATTSAAAVVD